MDIKTIEAYDQYAQAYDDQTAQFWEQFPKDFLDTFTRLAKGKVLDVGSGPGRDGILLQRYGLDVLCLDASKAMIDLCTQKGLPAIQGTFTDLPFENNAFDGAWAYTSLLHGTTSEAIIALQELKRVIKPEGFLGLGLIEGDTEEYRESEKIPLPRFFRYYQQKEVEDILGELGFQIVYTQKIRPGKRNYLHIIAKNSL